MGLTEKEKAESELITRMREAYWQALAPFASKPCADPECVGESCIGSFDADAALVAACDLVITLAIDRDLTFATLIQGLSKLARPMGMPLGLDVQVVEAEAPRERTSDRLPRAGTVHVGHRRAPRRKS